MIERLAQKFSSAVRLFQSGAYGLLATRLRETASQEYKRLVVKMTTTSADKNVLNIDWLSALEPSGAPAKGYEQTKAGKLSPGLTALIRAKNEERNIEQCLTPLSDIFSNVVFVDNGSTDKSGQLAQAFGKKIEHFQFHEYSKNIPPSGAQHAAVVLAGEEPTLGSYYNYCVSKVQTHNFIKWDCDFVPITENITELKRQTAIETRSDKIAIWCGGVAIWTDGEAYWWDREAYYNEFRVFSHQHGARYVNLPEWEEIDQSYLYVAQKLSFLKPIFAEIKRIDEMNFDKRGFNDQDIRDLKNREALRNYETKGTLPQSRFQKIDNIAQATLNTLTLSNSEIQAADRSVSHFRALPKITLDEKLVAVAGEQRPFHSLFLLEIDGNSPLIPKATKKLAQELSRLNILWHYFDNASQTAVTLDNMTASGCSWDDLIEKKENSDQLNALLDTLQFTHIVKVPMRTAVAPSALMQHIAFTPKDSRFINAEKFDARFPENSATQTDFAAVVRCTSQADHLESQSKLLSADKTNAVAKRLKSTTDWYPWKNSA